MRASVDCTRGSLGSSAKALLGQAKRRDQVRVPIARDADPVIDRSG